MNKLNSLVRKSGVVWTFLGVGIRALGQWGFIWLLVRWFGPEEVGRYGLATALVVPVTAFSSLHMMRFQATDYRGDFSFRDYLNLRYVMCIAALVVLLIGAYYSPSNVRLLILVLSAQLLTLSVVEIFQGRVLQLGDSAGYGKSLTTINSATWLAAVLALLLTKSMEAALTLSTLAAAGTLLFVLLPKVRSLQGNRITDSVTLLPRMPIRKELVLFRATIPLGLGLLVDSVMTQLPRLFLRSSGGDYELGILVGLLAFLSIGALVIESVTQAGTPFITRLVSREDFQRLRKVIAAFTVIIIVASAALALAAYEIGPGIAAAILSEEYGSFPISLAGIAIIFGLQFTFRFYMIVITASRRVDSILVVNLVSLICAAIAAWILIPRYGVDGAVLTIAVANTVRWALIVGMLARIPGMVYPRDGSHSPDVRALSRPESL